MTENASPATSTERTMIVIAGDKVAIQPRTSEHVALPMFFFLEPENERRELTEEQQNDINYHHQVDPRRASSHSPIMPCIQRYRETGNAYPEDVNDEAIITSKRWRPYAAISHAVFKLLLERTDPVAPIELVDDAVLLAGVGRTKKGAISPDAVACVNDTFRDLRLYGFLVSNTATRTMKATKYTLADLDALRIFGEPDEQPDEEQPTMDDVVADIQAMMPEGEPAEIEQEPAEVDPEPAIAREDAVKTRRREKVAA